MIIAIAIAFLHSFIYTLASSIILGHTETGTGGDKTVNYCFLKLCHPLEAKKH